MFQREHEEWEHNAFSSTPLVRHVDPVQGAADADQAQDDDFLRAVSHQVTFMHIPAECQAMDVDDVWAIALRVLDVPCPTRWRAGPPGCWCPGLTTAALLPSTPCRSFSWQNSKLQPRTWACKRFLAVVGMLGGGAAVLPCLGAVATTGWRAEVAPSSAIG